jgi:DNA-binding NtrC family response regulator
LRGSETVLLAEDNDQLRAALRALLERHGYKVIEAHDGREAFLICEKHPERIDLVISDVVMPRVTGSELARRIGAVRPGTPVLLMSGHVQDATLRERGFPGAFLQKPAMPQALLMAVRELLDARRPAAILD